MISGPHCTAAVFCLLVQFAASAVANSAMENSTLDQMSACDDFLWPDQIDACTAIIRSGELPKEILAASHVNRANAYHFNRDYDRAVEDFTQAITLMPGKAEHFWWRGLAYRESGNFSRAIQDLSEATRLAPFNVELARDFQKAILQNNH